MSYLLIGLAGPELTRQEREWLRRPQVGGLTLFSRNIVSLDQVCALVEAIREADPAALICIDQEGGRVQRMGEPCTVLPPLRALGDCYRDDDDEGITLAYQHAWLMASEMRALGIDLSFAPVLDIDCGSAVIGDRAFAADPLVVKELARAYIKGMHAAGMPATGKHFPGHGSIVPDTHVDHASDDRSFEDLAISDLRPFTVAVGHGLDAVMMAHVSYPQVCSQAAGYSSTWINAILRDRIGFQGIVFSDDLGMRAAEIAGNFQQRLTRSMDAGCDFALVCNADDVALAFEQIGEWPEPAATDPRSRLRLKPPPIPTWNEFVSSADRELARTQLESLA